MKALIKRLRELEGKATPVKWGAHMCDDDVFGIYAEVDVTPVGDIITEQIVETDAGVYPPNKADAELIAETRNALPKLLDYVEKLEAVAEAAQVLCDSLQYCGTSSSGYDSYRLNGTRLGELNQAGKLREALANLKEEADG